ncbi:hypothetical protein D5952_22025 [Salmonella enterica subsp. enterica]|uniref:Uncharacterized protein n=1 Tax=Salmonella enterica TaxID=28901 RepID=A0A763ZMK0_SALER|nr:hypothetical protein [Salmonella enterica subsp. enterica serovar Bonn]EDP8924086.1 hypothetical protein [Salmonella enterica subsp. enterica serovar Hadar]EEB5495887.1 hypothetical protein [Salmonella enterica]MLZ42550.1 hypothetical protein [Salmonella enterica subsp. enterica serovar Bonn]HAG4692352.1 hypothetical protein [Salmonella enterica]
MTFEFEHVRMHTTVVEMRSFASGEKYEAKVTNVYSYDGNEIPLPKGHYVWGFAWGKSYQEAKENAENMNKTYTGHAQILSYLQPPVMRLDR